MKKIKITLLCIFVAATAAMSLYSCKSGSNGEAPAKFDYQMMGDPAELNKWYSTVLEKFGTGKNVAQELSMNVSRPSCEGSIQTKGAADYLVIQLSFQSPADKTKLHEIDYFGHINGWQNGEDKEVRVSGGSDAESFKLEDYLFDISAVTPDLLNKVVKDALAKYKDEAKYKYQYVSSIKINQGGIEVYIHGKLASNGLEKSERYQTDLKGVAQ